MIDLARKRVTVVGLGRFGGGIGVTQWLCRNGAEVTVSDRASVDDLADSVAQLEGLDVKLHLGGHDLDDFLHADLLVVSPAIPQDIPPLKAAAQAGVPHHRNEPLHRAVRRADRGDHRLGGQEHHHCNDRRDTLDRKSVV